MAGKKKSVWMRLAEPFNPPKIEPAHPTATSGMKAVAEWSRGAPAPQAPQVDMSLTGDLSSASAYQQAAQRASDILFRKTNSPDNPPTVEELAFLQAWQNRSLPGTTP